MLRSTVDIATGANIVPGRLELMTANTSGTLTTAVYINSSQQVGIGTNILTTGYRATINTAATGSLSLIDGVGAAYEFSANRNITHYNTLSAPAAVANSYRQYSSGGRPTFITAANNTIQLYQETTGVAAGTLVSNLGIPLTSTDTIDGYTLVQVVRAVRLFGLLA